MSRALNVRSDAQFEYYEYRYINDFSSKIKVNDHPLNKLLSAIQAEDVGGNKMYSIFVCNMGLLLAPVVRNFSCYSTRSKVFSPSDRPSPQPVNVITKLDGSFITPSSAEEAQEVIRGERIRFRKEIDQLNICTAGKSYLLPWIAKQTKFILEQMINEERAFLEVIGPIRQKTSSGKDVLLPRSLYPNYQNEGNTPYYKTLVSPIEKVHTFLSAANLFHDVPIPHEMVLIDASLSTPNQTLALMCDVGGLLCDLPASLVNACKVSLSMGRSFINQEAQHLKLPINCNDGIDVVSEDSGHISFSPFNDISPLYSVKGIPAVRAFRLLSFIPSAPFMIGSSFNDSGANAGRLKLFVDALSGTQEVAGVALSNTILDNHDFLTPGPSANAVDGKMIEEDQMDVFQHVQ